nr:helicase-related protein [Anoxybacter fermentans]
MVTIVISPLKALMVDQVKQLKEKGIDFVEYINSDLTQKEKEDILEKVKKEEVSILYVSPEFLLAYDIRTIIGEERKLGLLVIDEAHLVTTWGRDFRVDYWYLGTYIKKLRNNRFYDFGNFVIASFTATAVYGGNDDMVYETIDSLYMKNPIKYLGNTRRKNIKFIIRNWKVERSYQEERQQKTIDCILSYIKDGKKAILYAPYRRHIDELMEMIPREYGHRVVKYYGNLEPIYKDFYEEKFRNGEANVMLATKAFGMGIDISDIEIVYHHAPTGNLCDYIQEIGRVGRDQSIMGLAIQDFNPKDLSFSKILYSLSSIKQYQLREVIKKIYSIYKQKRRRNFLINAETFSYLFPDDENYENKVKNALLLIEKDLEKKYTYPVLIVRPKSLFSKAYAAVPSGIVKKFKNSKYYKYAKKISEVQSSKIYNEESKGSSIFVQDIGPIYEFDLKSLWEDHYSDMTFPVFKKKFYDLELFDFKENIVPRYKLTISLNKSIYDTRKALEENISNIIKCFDIQKKGFFSREEFSELLKTYFPKEAIRRKIINTFIDLFVIKYGEDNKNKFIQKRISKGNSDREEFRLQSKIYHRVFRDILNRYLDLSKNMVGDDMTLCRYLAVKENNLYMTLAYTIEAFSLGSYDVRGGESPEIFIRVNDPSKLRVLSTSSNRYSNLILKDIRQRQKRSSEILKKFFTELDDDEMRWDFIEEYFLGRINLD